MGRIALVLFLVFAALLVLRALRLILAAFLTAQRPPAGKEVSIEGEMVRDPVCGTWIDRRLALAARSGEEWVPVCSENCRERAAAIPAGTTPTRAGQSGGKGS